jgi:acyl-CoA reductase-like NAD-dependent aldehyde dehydrogenase
MGPLNNARPPRRWTATSPTPASAAPMSSWAAEGRAAIPTDLYYDFTMIDRVPEDSLVSREESFGPVLPILVAKDDDDAIGISNRTNLGLQAAVFTNDLSKAFWYADRIRSGTVVVNDSTDFWETFQPFGGAAGTDTGWGRQRIEEFTDLQTIVFSLREDPTA